MDIDPLSEQGKQTIVSIPDERYPFDEFLCRLSTDRAPIYETKTPFTLIPGQTHHPAMVKVAYYKRGPSCDSIL